MVAVVDCPVGVKQPSVGQTAVAVAVPCSLTAELVAVAEHTNAAVALAAMVPKSCVQVD